MREIKLDYITMDGRQWPLYCDLNVLEEIQERFTSITEFNRQIAGWEIIRNEDGTPVFFTEEENKDLAGEMKVRKVRKVLPKIGAIKTGLFLMIREGLLIEEDQGKEPVEDAGEITQEYIARICDVDYYYVAELLNEQLRRCFEIKKKENARRKKTKNT